MIGKHKYILTQSILSLGILLIFSIYESNKDHDSEEKSNFLYNSVSLSHNYWFAGWFILPYLYSSLLTSKASNKTLKNTFWYCWMPYGTHVSKTVVILLKVIKCQGCLWKRWGRSFRLSVGGGSEVGDGQSDWVTHSILFNIFVFAAHILDSFHWLLPSGIS